MNKSIKEKTLEQIKNEEIKIKPKLYFKILKGFIHVSIIILGLLSIYIFNLIFYLPSRSLRFAEKQGLSEYLSLFPWPLLFIGALTVAVLIYLYKNYEGGYKKHLVIITLLIFGSVLLVSGFLVKSNFNQKIEERPGFRRMYDWKEDKFLPKEQRRRHQRLKQNNPDCLKK